MRRSTLSTFSCRARGRRSTLCTETANFMAGAALREPRTDCVAGAALGEHLSISADFVAGAAIANLEVQIAWRA